MIPSKRERAEWRQLADDTQMVSAVGEYTPAEFTTLLDAVDALEIVLKKYISHVGYNEGIDFLRDIDKSDKLTDQEWDYLRSVSESKFQFFAPDPQGTESRVCEDIALRQAKGLSKYGTTVENNPLNLREWLQHAYEEALDMAIYLKRSIEKLDEVKQ